jgi:hypothetical protein
MIIWYHKIVVVLKKKHKWQYNQKEANKLNNNCCNQYNIINHFKKIIKHYQVIKRKVYYN